MIKLKSLLTELKPMSGKPKIGDYIRSGKLFGKIVELETRKGKKLAGIEPSSGVDRSGCHSSAYTGTSRDPKIEIDYAVERELHNAPFFGTNF